MARKILYNDPSKNVKMLKFRLEKGVFNKSKVFSFSIVS
jgi:hypothetical protein